MTVFGMPESMFLIFVATIIAGNLGALHYVIVHVLLGKPFGDEDDVEETEEEAKPVIEAGEVND
ncbi:hypothetical protein SAMN04487967_0781 [Natronorubrum sediminis]|uniref:Uncharacterized protein n=1 Tax=Natronorubrum sediminis TaxID=640943 RepID=A0A1H6FQG6_9EURY|nr:hypothetical protein [Natronorubrum sediminis]SEH12378.1 hypothetical protein SAMN04487967_0781 [Natronorubrum sediminis]